MILYFFEWWRGFSQFPFICTHKSKHPQCIPDFEAIIWIIIYYFKHSEANFMGATNLNFTFIPVRDSTWMSAMPLHSVRCLLALMQVTTSHNFGCLDMSTPQSACLLHLVEWSSRLPSWFIHDCSSQTLSKFDILDIIATKSGTIWVCFIFCVMNCNTPE